MLLPRAEPRSTCGVSSTLVAHLRTLALLVAACLLWVAPAGAEPFEDRFAAARALLEQRDLAEAELAARALLEEVEAETGTESIEVVELL